LPLFLVKGEIFGGFMKHGYFKGKKVAEVQDSQTSLMDRFKKQGIVNEWREADADPKKAAEAERLEAERKAAAEKAEAEKLAAEKEAATKTEAERLEAEKAKGGGGSGSPVGYGSGHHEKK
jgi:membrane protein involved in colicin uptake